MAAVKAGVDSIEHGTLLTGEIVQAMKDRGTFLVPTVYLVESFGLDAFRYATRHAAKLLGVKDRGQLLPGLRADIIAVSGNPLENIQTLESAQFVMKKGRLLSSLSISGGGPQR